MRTKLIILMAALCSGCAHMGSSTHTDLLTYHLNPDGTTNSITRDVGETRLFGFALLDSNQALQKASNQSGYSQHGTNSSFAPGTFMGGLNQSASSTNLVQELIMALKIIEALKGP